MADVTASEYVEREKADSFERPKSESSVMMQNCEKTATLVSERSSLEDQRESQSDRNVPLRNSERCEVVSSKTLPTPETELCEDYPWPEDATSGMTEADLGDVPMDWEVYDNEDELEDETPINVGENKKRLEVSADRPKTAQPDGGDVFSGNTLQRWKQVVSQIGEPLSMILARARVDCFTRNGVEVTLPTVYRDMITSQHIREIERCLCNQVSESCRLALHYAEIGSDSETLAAQKAREQLAAQEKAFNQVREHEIMKRIVEIFHVESEAIRFTINPDRTIT